MSDDAIKLLDVDGDGKLTMNDVKTVYDKYDTLLKSFLPSLGGFASGFMIGMKFGI